MNAVDDAQKTPRTLASNRASRSLLGKLEKEARAIRNASDLKASHLVRPRVQTAEVSPEYSVLLQTNGSLYLCVSPKHPSSSS